MPVKKRNRATTSNNKSNDLRLSQTIVATSTSPVPVAITVQAERLDPNEVARFVKNAGDDDSCQIVRHLAIYRLALFLQLVHAYVVYLPHLELNRHILDAWFRYDQFSFFFSLAPKQGDVGSRFFCLSILTSAVFFGMLTILGGMNGVNKSFEFSGSFFLFCFAARFFLLAPHYSDALYLLFLLGIITVVSGGGSFFLIFTAVDPNMTEEQKLAQQRKRQLLIQSSEWGAITLRLQYAVFYFYSSLWKLHADFLSGNILRAHLVGLEDQADTATQFWKVRLDTFGHQMFQIMGLLAFLMDFGMFLVLTLRRPANETARTFVFWSVAFHAIVALTLRETMAYPLYVTCFLGTLIFHPIGGGSTVDSDIDSANSAQGIIRKRIRSRQQSAEANLLEWIHRYATNSYKARATRPQQLFTLAWLIVQILTPLRMPYVSGGQYPFTSQGVRFSWTLGMHRRQTSINHLGKYTTTRSPTAQIAEKIVPLHLLYLVPECSGQILQRRDYMPERAVATEDPRTLPFQSIISEPFVDFLRGHPRFIGNVAGGMSLLLHQVAANACGGPAHVAVYGVHFVKVNRNGAYCRVIDPTVNLALSELARYQLSLTDRLWGVFTDQAINYEFVFSSGIGSMNHRIGLYQAAVEKAAQNARRIEYVADRAACLAQRPLALWPNGYPLGVMSLELPRDVKLHVTYRVHAEAAKQNLTVTVGNQWDILDAPKSAELKLQRLYSVSAVSVELSVIFVGERAMDCSSTQAEDVLIALVFMS